MCWSFGASTVFAIIGILAAIYLIYKKESKLLWIPILYFAAMEVLQALTYLTINQCNLPMNQLLTYISYLHSVFQPFFMNAFFLYFIPKEVRNKISGWVFAICFIASILLLIQVYPFSWAGTCSPSNNFLDLDRAWCGTNICSMSGSWHLIWNIPLNEMTWLGILGYLFPIFILPLIYGSWKVLLYQTILGPALTLLIIANPAEFPAVWCFLSVAIIILAIFTPLKNLAWVKRWYFWKYPIKIQKEQKGLKIK